jgi:hypothetical protein
VTRLGRVASAALVIAAGCGVALIVAAFLAPVYESTSASSSGASTHGTDTLVGVNGVGIVAVTCVPLLVTLLVGLALSQRSRRGALAVAWGLTGVLAVLNLLAMFSIGLFVLPVTAALIVACASCRPLPTGRSPHGQPPTGR